MVLCSNLIVTVLNIVTENRGQNWAVSLMCAGMLELLLPRLKILGVFRCCISLGKRLLWDQYKENILCLCERMPKNI